MIGIKALRDYKPKSLDELISLNRMIALYDMHEKNAFLRTCLPGHFTASAWVMNLEYDRVLLMHHFKLDKWLQPGGHCEGDEDFQKVAKKEVLEETGLPSIANINKDIFDLDIHLVPSRKNEPSHYHYDIRYLVTADDKIPLQGNQESNALKWATLDEIPKLTQEHSVLRMLEKSLKEISQKIN